jgi:hypothetical protein
VSDDLPTADELNAAAGDEEDRATEIQALLDLKQQAKDTLVDVLSKGLGAAVGSLPIPSELISEAAGAIVDQVLDTIEEV